MKATNLLHQVMRTVFYCRIATAIEMASKGGGHVAYRCVDCVLGGRRGDTKRVVARWRSLVAFIKGLDLLNWEMCSVLHRRTAMAIEMAHDGGSFVRHRRCYGPFKLTPSYYINLIGVISLLVFYWPPPTTRDAVSATIFAGGQARIRLNIEVN
jgi:hypothetical protein